VFTFQGRYECCYERDGDRSIVWASQGEGNIETRGRATVFDGEQPGSVRLDYEADMALEIDVNQLLAPVLDPVVRASISQQMRAYVKRMIDAIPKSA
jgi:carbon monoxide dehydrogenase subunit G